MNDRLTIAQPRRIQLVLQDFYEIFYSPKSNTKCGAFFVFVLFFCSLSVIAPSNLHDQHKYIF